MDKKTEEMIAIAVSLDETTDESRTEIVRALLDKGTDKNARNKAGRTALESVAGPFDDVKGIYDSIGKGLRPLGLKLDYERIIIARPRIAWMLCPRTEDL
jgi:hypothetical protein